MDLADRRQSYESAGIDVDSVDPDPMVEFEQWYRTADEADLWEPNAAVLASTDSDGWPGARYVLVKSFDARGFVFYTNYESDKAVALDASGRAALTFGWLPLRRQVRIVGDVERTSAGESDDYFDRRPRGSQLGAMASPQSRVIASRGVLDERHAALAAEAGDGLLIRPAHWGGYRIKPRSIEFWQGRPSRLHDRVRYDRSDGAWTRVRLAP
jgi:pyridoxamine 5'-phosphate oxidase